MRGATRPAIRRCWRGILIAAAMVGSPLQADAQPAVTPVPTGDEALVLSADAALAAAMRAGDKSVPRRILSLQFSFVDEDGKAFERKEFLAGLKDLAGTAPSDVKVKIYGRVAMVTGHRKSAHDTDVFFLDIWARQKGAWRALVTQDVELAADNAAAPSTAAAESQANAYDCKNPCEVIPYRVRSPAEQDVVSSFQAIERAAVGHDADEWSRHVADEFVLYGSGRAPIPKADRIAAIKRQKASNATVRVGEVETMRLSVYEDGAAMIATHALPDNSRPPYRAARVWVKRNGQWLMAISVQTEIKNP